MSHSPRIRSSNALIASGRDSVTNPIDRSSGRFGLAWMDHLSVLNSRIGFSSFPVRVTVGLESNASELVLHVQQTVRACAIDYDDPGMATMFHRTGLSGRQLALVDVAILPTQERK